MMISGKDLGKKWFAFSKMEIDTESLIFLFAVCGIGYLRCCAVESVS